MTPGDTTQLTVTVRNVSDKPVAFDNICAVQVRVLAVGDATDVTKEGPGPCPAIYAPVTLEPDETFDRTFSFDATVWTCIGGTCSHAPYAAGDYLIRGVLFYEQGPVVSAPASLEVR